MNCDNCGQSLRQSQWTERERFKSCPKCSQMDGKEHVFYPLLAGFGITDARSSKEHPEGPQSYCVGCRERGEPPAPVRCGDVNEAELALAKPVAPKLRRKE